MKNRIWLIMLILVCVGLAIAVLSVKNQADKQLQDDTVRIVNYSNQWVETSDSLNNEKRSNTLVVADLSKQRSDFQDLTNNFQQLSTDYAKSEASLKTALEETAKRDSKIADLEAQNQALDQRSADLTAAITNLTAQIEDTRKKLNAAEGDKSFLEKELQRLMAEKADLEKKFNDLVVVKAQVAKLKEELSIARRLEWIRQGLSIGTEQHGAQQLMQNSAANQQPRPATNTDLNVEINSDGSVKIIPPLTNRPPLTTPPQQ